MWIPWTWIYDRKKISSNSNNLNYDFNASAQKNIKLTDTNIDMWIFRKILLYIQRFFAIIFSLSFLMLIFDGEIGAAIFTLLIIILIDYYDFKLIKNKLFSKDVVPEDREVENINNNEEINDSNLISEYQEVEDSYHILKSEDGELLNTQDHNYFNTLEKEKEAIYQSYWKLSIEFEEIKNFWDPNKMVDFETKVHNYFSEDVLPLFLNLKLIDSIDPIKDKVKYDNRDFNTYDYIWKLVPDLKFQEFKEIISNRDKFYKQWVNDYLYDLYAKSLRRIWNYYKQKKLWKESLNIFTIIEDMWQAGIMDKKSIIKIKKELSS